MGGLFGGSKPPPGPSQEELDRQADREARERSTSENET